jgi:hypothetical protein
MEELRQAGNFSADPEKAKEEGEIHLLTRDDVEFHWPEVSRALDEHPEQWNSFYTKESFFERLVDGRMQMWAVRPSATGGNFTLMMFTQVMPTDVGAMLNVPWIYGVGATRALNLMALALIRFARETGCRKIFMEGRDGWQKYLHHVGAQRVGVTYTLDVKDVRMQ